VYCFEWMQGGSRQQEQEGISVCASLSRPTAAVADHLTTPIGSLAPSPLQP